MVDTVKDRCLCNECIDVRQVTVVSVTTVCNKYFKLKGCKCCEARLKYSNLRLPKAELRRHIVYQTKLPEEKRLKHRNKPKPTIIIANEDRFLN